MSFKNQVARYLTLENAKEYDSKTDKWLWIADNILDEIGVSATDARVNWIEDRFDELLSM